MPKKMRCPVCGGDVGKDPHEECLDSIEPLDTGPPPVMPCPACGNPLVPGHDCES